MQTVRFVLEDFKNMQLLPLMFVVVVMSGMASSASVGGHAGSCCIPDSFSGRMLFKSYDQGGGNDPLDRTLTGMDELQFVVDSAHRRIFGRHEGRTEVGSPFDWKYIFGGNNEVGHEAEMHLHVVDSMNNKCFKIPLETGTDIAKFENLCTSLNFDGLEPLTVDHLPDSLKFVLDRDSDEQTHVIVSRDACNLLKTEMTTVSGGVQEAEFLLDDLSNAAEAQRRQFTLPSYCDNALVVHNWPHTSPAFALLGRMFLPGVFSKPCCDFPDLIDNAQPTENAREQGYRNENSHFDDTEGGRGRQDRITSDQLRKVLVEVLSAGTSKEPQAEKSDVLRRNALIKYELDKYLQGRDSKEEKGIVDRSQDDGLNPSFDFKKALIESVIEELINEENLIPNDPRGLVELKDALIEAISGEENDEQEAGDDDDDDQRNIGEFGGDDDERYFATDDLKVMVLKVLFDIEDGRDDTDSDSEDGDIDGSESSDVNDDADRRESEDENTDRSESNDVDDGNKGELVSAVETLDHIEEDQTGNTNNLPIERHGRSKRHSRRHSRDKKASKAKRKDDKKKEKSKVEEDKKKEKSKVNEDKSKAKSKSHEVKKKQKMHKALKVIGKITAAIVVGLS